MTLCPNQRHCRAWTDSYVGYGQVWGEVVEGMQRQLQDGSPEPRSGAPAQGLNSLKGAMAHPQEASTWS